MKKLKPLQIIVLILVFVALGFGYIYFKEQSLLNSGKSAAGTTLRSINTGDKEYVKTQLLEFAGLSEEAAEDNPVVRLALINVNFLSGKDGDLTAKFVDHYVDEKSDPDVYRAIYEIPAEQGDVDFVVMVLSKDQDKAGWRLANVVLTATNPL